MAMDDELRRFKTEINLTEYMAFHGYRKDHRESSKKITTMRHTDGDKLLVVLGSPNWVYCSIRNESDNGTIVDFLQNRTGLNFGQVRKELRPWIGEDRTKYHAETSDYSPKQKRASHDIATVLLNFGKMQPIKYHPYLSQRGIPAVILADRRLLGRIYIDRYQNAVFPHWRKGGELCGYEIKNKGFTGFAAGGEKGLWVTRGGDRVCALSLQKLPLIP